MSEGGVPRWVGALQVQLVAQQMIDGGEVAAHAEDILAALAAMDRGEAAGQAMDLLQ